MLRLIETPFYWSLNSKDYDRNTRERRGGGGEG